MPSSYSKVCVTGGAGFIGSHLVDRLLDEGYEVIAIDNLLTGKLENIKHNLDRKNFQFVNCDIRDYRAIKSLVKDVDVIFHEAALTSVKISIRRPSLVNDINVTGTLKLLEASLNSNVKRFIYASSAAVYGNIPSPQREDMTPQPISIYGASKLAAENYVKVYYEVYGLKTLCLRYFNVYGPRQSSDGRYSGVITKFIKAILCDKPLYIYGDGQQTRDFIHVQDIIQANLLALKSREAIGKVFNIGTGRSSSINELYTMILNLMNRDERSVRVIRTKPREGEIRYSCADITRAKAVMGFSPSFDLEMGLFSLIKGMQKLNSP